MATAISSLYPHLRHALGDRQVDHYRYQDSALLNGVKFVIQCGKVPDYTISIDGLSVTPDLTDPNKFALVLLYTALSFIISEPNSEAFRQRSMSRSIGGFSTFISELHDNINELENGTYFTSWRTFLSWEDRYIHQNLPSVCADDYSTGTMFEDTSLPADPVI